MPYTPLHMGPGMFLKATMPRHFSIITFGITQVLIDLEVLWNMTHHSNRLHTFLHTYWGASLVVLITIPLGKTLGTWVRRVWNLATQKVPGFDLTFSRQTPWAAIVLGAAIGAYSHVLFDSCYHVDVEPFLPWSASNPCKGAVEPFKMEIVFNALFIFGLVWLTVGVILKKRAQRGRVANASTLR